MLQYKYCTSRFEKDRLLAGPIEIFYCNRGQGNLQNRLQYLSQDDFICPKMPQY